MKYQGDYTALWAQVSELLGSAQKDLNKQEEQHRFNIDNLILKRKQLKKCKDELQLLKDLKEADKRSSVKPSQTTAARAHKGKGEDEDLDRDENTEDSIIDGQNEGREDHDEEGMVPAVPYDDQRPFGRLTDAMRGHRAKEDRLVRIGAKAESIVLLVAHRIDRMKAAPKDNNRARLFYFQDIAKLALECDQIITSQKSKINMNDFLMDDPDTLFSKFGKADLLKATDSAEEDKLLIKVTLENDRMIGNFITPGEFISQLEISQHNGDPIEVFLCEIKYRAHDNMVTRMQESLLKLLELLDLIQKQGTNYTSQTRNTQLEDVQSVVRKDTSNIEQSVTERALNTTGTRFRQQENSTASQQLIAEHFNKKYNTKTSEKWLGSDKAAMKERAGSSNTHGQYSSSGAMMTAHELESYRRERDALIGLYPQIKDIDPESEKEEEELSHERGYNHESSKPSKSDFNRTGTIYRPSEKKPPQAPLRKVATSKPRGRLQKPAEDLDPITIQAPKGDRARSNDYRIKTTSNQTSSRMNNGVPSESKVSPYAQTLAGLDDRRRKVLRLIH